MTAGHRALLQDLEKNVLSQDTSVLENGHNILVLLEKKKRQLDAIFRKFVVTNVHIYDTLTSCPCAVHSLHNCAWQPSMQGAPLPLDALDIRWKAPEYSTWSQHSHTRVCLSIVVQCSCSDSP